MVMVHLLQVWSLFDILVVLYLFLITVEGKASLLTREDVISVIEHLELL